LNEFDKMTIRIAPLSAEDRDRWNLLARGYKRFYETTLTDAEYDHVWMRLMTRDRIFGLGATLDGRLVGITHYLFHTTIWTERVCYLHDLFVDPLVRGRGVARALIDGVAQAAKDHEAARMYWMTNEQNATARTLYDRVANYNGFIRYEMPLG